MQCPRKYQLRIPREPSEKPSARGGTKPKAEQQLKNKNNDVQFYWRRCEADLGLLADRANGSGPQRQGAVREVRETFVPVASDAAHSRPNICRGSFRSKGGIGTERGGETSLRHHGTKHTDNRCFIGRPDNPRMFWRLEYAWLPACKPQLAGLLCLPPPFSVGTAAVWTFNLSSHRKPARPSASTLA